MDTKKTYGWIWGTTLLISSAFAAFQYYLSEYYYSLFGTSVLIIHVLIAISFLVLSMSFHDFFRKSGDVSLINASQVLSIIITMISCSILFSAYLYIPQEFFKGHLSDHYINQSHSIISFLNYYLNWALIACPFIVICHYYADKLRVAAEKDKFDA